MILCLFFVYSNNSLSSSSSLFASRTRITKSAFSMDSFDLSIPIFSTSSEASLIPAVSKRLIINPFKLICPSTISLVVPGTLVNLLC